MKRDRISISEAARRRSVDRTTVYLWIKRGLLTAYAVDTPLSPAGFYYVLDALEVEAFCPPKRGRPKIETPADVATRAAQSGESLRTAGTAPIAPRTKQHQRCGRVM